MPPPPQTHCSKGYLDYELERLKVKTAQRRKRRKYLDFADCWLPDLKTNLQNTCFCNYF